MVGVTQSAACHFSDSGKFPRRKMIMKGEQSREEMGD
jgi:hypothetical protein